MGEGWVGFVCLSQAGGSEASLKHASPEVSDVYPCWLCSWDLRSCSGVVPLLSTSWLPSVDG
jgi:hypothetical protein